MNTKCMALMAQTKAALEEIADPTWTWLTAGDSTHADARIKSLKNAQRRLFERKKGQREALRKTIRAMNLVKELLMLLQEKTDTSVSPLNGKKTHPLSTAALEVLASIGTTPMPRQEVNPSVANRLERGGLVENVDLPSPYLTKKGRVCHLRITKEGRRVLGDAQ